MKKQLAQMKKRDKIGDSMELLNKSELMIKKSKFIGLLYKIDTQEEAEKILADLRLEHKKARHLPYAYKVGGTAKKTDDKEPSGTAGTPIWNIIERNKLDGVLIVVIRYFGGVKLGSGPLLRAYSSAANELVKH